MADKLAEIKKALAEWDAQSPKERAMNADSDAYWAGDDASVAWVGFVKSLLPIAEAAVKLRLTLETKGADYVSQVDGSTLYILFDRLDMLKGE